MKPINIAVFGSSGAIGEAICIEYAKKRTLKIFLHSLEKETH
jgi:hypothetical protein